MYSQRRDVFTRYIDEVVNACGSITRINRDNFRRDLVRLAKRSTAQADMEFDEHGKIVKKKGGDPQLADTIVVDRDNPDAAPETLFPVDKPKSSTRRASKRAASRKPSKKTTRRKAAKTKARRKR